MYDDPFSTVFAGFGAMIAALAVIMIVPLIIAYVLFSVFYMKLFEKAGVNDKWRAWVPVYREMIFFKIGDMNPWLVLIFGVGGAVLSVIYIGSLLLAAFTVFWAMAIIRISFKAKNEAAWAALALGLPGLGSIIWLGIMAFAKDPWQPHIPQAKWAHTFLGDKTNWQDVPFGGIPAPAYGGQQPYGYEQPGYGSQPYGSPYGQPAAPQQPYPEQPYPEQFGQPQPPQAPQSPYDAPAAPRDPYEAPAAPQDPFAAPAAPQDPFSNRPSSDGPDTGDDVPDSDPTPPNEPPRI